MTPQQFHSFLTAAVARTEVVMRKACEEIGRSAVKRAQDKLGYYQTAVDLVIPGVGGPFPKWEELTDETVERKLRGGFPSPSPLYRSGEMHDSIQYSLETQWTDEITIRVFVAGEAAEWASYQEFGTEFMPPRPFLMPAVFERLPKWIEKFQDLMIINLLPRAFGETVYFD